MVPFAWSEILNVLDLVGSDRWVHELLLKHGAIDGITASVGGRWMVNLWSTHKLEMTPKMRLMIAALVTPAAVRLEELVRPLVADSGGARVALTPRELAVLRGASLGRRFAIIAKELGLSVETVRSHMKRAQQKLGVQNSAHAVAEAFRHQLLV
jgi:LuxR family quorum sensing-dependent transcriptional regulator